jgi:lysophospholipase L1-like esterase
MWKNIMAMVGGIIFAIIGVEGVLDLYPVMSAYEEVQGVQLYYADRVHWNERGHRLIADELKKVLQLSRALS